MPGVIVPQAIRECIAQRRIGAYPALVLSASEQRQRRIHYHASEAIMHIDVLRDLFYMLSLRVTDYNPFLKDLVDTFLRELTYNEAVQGFAPECIRVKWARGPLTEVQFIDFRKFSLYKPDDVRCTKFDIFYNINVLMQQTATSIEYGRRASVSAGYGTGSATEYVFEEVKFLYDCAIATVQDIRPDVDLDWPEQAE